MLICKAPKPIRAMACKKFPKNPLIYQKLCPCGSTLKPRHAIVRTLHHPSRRAEVLDPKALVLFFPAPQTVTGEDVLELHVHGGKAVVQSVLSAIALAATDDEGKSDPSIVRYAEPGEFTRRAFYNNRLDLTQVEALGDTLSAETEQQRRLAVKGTSAALSRQYESWRQQLLYARGELEALIDFSEDQHFDESPAHLIGSVRDQVLSLQRGVTTVIENASRGELLRNGIDLALVGAPNAGKSSLLNRIVGREAAIVSQEEGTTRDVIEVGLDIGGFYCKFGDVAGLRGKSTASEASISSIEVEGMRRAKERARVADVVIAIIPVEQAVDYVRSGRLQVEINDEVASTLRLCDLEKQSVIYVLNKIDLIGPNEDTVSMQGRLMHKISDKQLPRPSLPVLAVSCMEDQQGSHATKGVHEFLIRLTDLFQDMTAASGGDSAAWESSIGATERQRLLLEQCSSELQNFLDQLDRDDTSHDLDEDNIDIVLAAESLRNAADCLAKITGIGQVANVEEVLGVVFEK
ncbi:MAG: hypothetical protein Q9194_002300 [Teloschistes cf. exilis]